MAIDKDYLGDTLRRVERAREEIYFRQLDQELLAKMRQQEPSETGAPAAPGALFPSILVPVDFSPHAAEALRYATDLAARYASSIVVLHVIPRETSTYAVSQRLGHPHLPFMDFLSPQEAPEVPQQAAEEVIVNLREQAYTALQKFLPPPIAAHPVELRVLVGQPGERILETAAHEKVALIVLGTHGRTGLQRVLMGSVAERVVRLAPCPVLTVKAAAATSEV